MIILFHCSIQSFPFNFKCSPFLFYVQAISTYKDLKFQAPESLIGVNGAIDLGEKKEEEREGRRRRKKRGCAWRTESTAHWGPLSEAHRV
jgi:hypothetical protein